MTKIINKYHQLFLFSFLFLGFALPLVKAEVAEAGYYTNICGSGCDASFYACPADCNLDSGVCRAKTGEIVGKFICNGKGSACGGSNSCGGLPVLTPYWSGYGNEFSVKDADCGKTVQVDVWEKKPDGSPDYSKLKGYLVWYTGDCPTPPPPPPTPSCKPINAYVYPQPARNGEKITFTFTSSYAYVWVGLSVSGGVNLNNCEGFTATCSSPYPDGNPCWWQWKNCPTTQAGNFQANFWGYLEHEKRNKCEKSINFEIIQPNFSVSVSANPNSGCPDASGQLTSTITAYVTSPNMTADPGPFTYKFDCDNNGSWEYTFPNEGVTKAVPCAYRNTTESAQSQTYTAKVEVKSEYSNIVKSAQTTVTIGPKPPTVDIKAKKPSDSNFSDGPITIPYNSSAVLSWTSQRANSCTASGAWSGSKPLSGTESTGNLTSAKTYTLTCTNSCGTANDSVTINVESQPTLELNVSANPNSGCPPLTSVLTATVSGTALGTINYKFDCDNNGTWDGEYNNISETFKSHNCVYQNTTNNNVNYTAKVRVERGGLSQEKTVTIVVYPDAPTVDIKAKKPSDSNFSDGPITIPYNSSAVLSWTSQRANSCTASGAWSGSKPLSGTESTGNLTSAKTYTLTCTNSCGTANDSVNILVGEQPQPLLEINKTVKNISDDTSYKDSVWADPKETVRFKIEIKSSGTATLTNVRVKDVLPTKLIYLGNLKLNDQPLSGDLSQGINLGNLEPNAVKTITFDAKVAERKEFSYGTTTLTNKAYAWADNFGEINDEAYVKVSKRSSSSPSLRTELTIEKWAQNITQNQKEWSDSISANPSDRIMFKIKITNTGQTTLNDILVKDLLPQKMTYKGNLKINNQSSSQDIISGIKISSLEPGQSKEITFETELLSEENFNIGSTTLTNVARASNNEVSVSDEADVVVNRTAVAGAVTEVPTGIFDSVKISLIAAFFLTVTFSYLRLLKEKISFSPTKVLCQAKEKVIDSFSLLYSNPQKSERELKKLLEKTKNQEKS